MINSINKLINEMYNDAHYFRKNIEIGDFVCVVQKHHQRTGELTCGKVVKHLTSKSKHTRGIKVKIETEDTEEIVVGRVQEIYK